MKAINHKLLTSQNKRVLQAKQKTWSDIKQHLPEFAKFMLELKKEFGEIINVEIKVK